MGDVDLSVRLLVEMIGHGFGESVWYFFFFNHVDFWTVEEDDLDATADDLVAVLKARPFD